MQKKYIAYSSEFCEYEEFDTSEEAEVWLGKTWEEIKSNGEGYDPSMEGGDYIAEITHRSEFVETDKKSNYCQIECSECKKEECDGEKRSYDSEFEKVGHIKLRRMK